MPKAQQHRNKTKNRQIFHQTEWVLYSKENNQQVKKQTTG